MMAESSACVPSSILVESEDSNMDDSSLETLSTSAWDRADGVLQSLKESQAELLSRVQKLKEDWQVDVDLQMKSCDQEIEGLTYAHKVEVEGLRMELQSRANALKDQLNTLQQNWQLEVAALTNPVTSPQLCLANADHSSMSSQQGESLNSMTSKGSFPSTCYRNPARGPAPN